jgi:hypothetical protein
MLTSKHSTAFVGPSNVELTARHSRNCRTLAITMPCKGHTLSDAAKWRSATSPWYCLIVQYTLPGILHVTATVVAPKCSCLPLRFHALSFSLGASKSISTCTLLSTLILTLYTASDSNGSVTRVGSGSPDPDNGDIATFRRGVIRGLCSFRCLSHDFSSVADCSSSKGLS